MPRGVEAIEVPRLKRTAKMPWQKPSKQAQEEERRGNKPKFDVELKKAAVKEKEDTSHKRFDVPDLKHAKQTKAEIDHVKLEEANLKHVQNQQQVRMFT